MTFLNRSYNLTFVASGQTLTLTQTSEQRGLCIEFITTKTISKEPNVSEVTIYNASSQTINTLQKNGLLSLSCGYQDENSIIMSGWASDSEIKNDGKGSTSIKLSLIDGLGIDGNLLIKTEFSSKSTSTKIVAALVDFIKSKMLGIRIAPYIILTPIIYESSTSMFGDAYDLLDTTLRDCGYRVHIENGVLTILKATQSINEAFTVISSSTGMIGAAKPVKKLDSDNKAQVGCEFETILNPSLKLAKSVKVISNSVNDLFRLESIVHAGNSLEGTWTTKAKGWKYG